MTSQLGHISVGLADSIMIGALGTIPLAAGAFANSLFVVPMVFGLGMAMGITPPIANADGEGRPDKSASFLKNGLLINIVTAIILFLTCLIIIPVAPYLGQEAEVLERAIPYLVILSSSIFPLLIFLTFKQFAEGLSDTKTSMYISLFANGLNILLNYLFIYGHWGVPEMGLNGAAWASLISRIIMAAAMMYYIFKMPKFKESISYWKAAYISKERIKKILAIGVPSGFQYIFEVSVFAGAAILMGQINAESLAAHQIAISLAAVSYMAASGLAAAASVRIGNQLGKRDFRNLKMVGNTSLHLSIIFMAVCGIVYLSGRYYFPSFYSEDLAVIEIAAQLLIVATIFQIADGIQVVSLGVLRGMADTRVPTFISFLSYWLIGFGGAWFLGMRTDLGPLGVWFGLALGLGVASVLLYWRFNYLSNKLIRENE